MTSVATNRRPLKTRDTGWARTLSRWLARRRVAPNHISLLSLVWAALGALALVASSLVAPGPRVALLLAAAVCIQLRLLCNLLDGMVAIEGGMGSPAGEVYNDLPDRIADPLLIIPAGYASGLPLGPELGWAVGLLALFTAYIRMLGRACGLPQDFQGPMAKPQRMALLTLGLLVAALMVPVGLAGPVMGLTLALLLVGTLVTAARRTRAILAGLATR
jgi:phosphatidylglycerophosphate synthase